VGKDSVNTVANHGILSRQNHTDHDTRRRIKVGAAIGIVVLSLAGAVIISMLRLSGDTASIAHSPPTINSPQPKNLAQDPSRSAGIVIIHVHGAVARPGLYELSDGTRVIDAVTAAGGFADNADQSGVNLARTITDGEQLWVPAVGETVPPGQPAEFARGTVAGNRVNLNTASGLLKVWLSSSCGDWSSLEG
jgi:competence protein ComEA